ncbi:hypothetical protein [Staphylococcus felis]|uniref:Uncharacterized protein n=1 Tax=Staphylococcus felis TaxID=46127 RepID=A0ABS0QLR7_9STAP|nr:hypothetical protein [Staphylococcus felis]MBH9580076.1 hypothetical protein [Staphylococcus felis]REI09489.1 hypothetical protein DOS69_01760 [Staphylococcus felis]REI33635.1 hypothetical protein DOS82_05925 [Staphylococcus felis]
MPDINSTLDCLSEAGEMELNGQIKDLFISIVRPNGDLTIIHSPLSDTEKLGLLEASKIVALEES